MPLATLHLLAFQDAPKTLRRVLRHLTTLKPAPLTISQPVRWIIRPESIDKTRLLQPQASQWHLLVIVLGNSKVAPLTADLTLLVVDHFSLAFGVPSKVLTDDWPARNNSLLHPPAQSELTGALKDPKIAGSSQGLELTNELRTFAQEWDRDGDKKGAVSMLNLLAFHPGEEAHNEYAKYGKAFAESIGSKRGGIAKLVGRTVPDQGQKPPEWEEVALAQYPSIQHFADMLASKDYQEVNQRHRVKSLRDTCILMTSEIEIERLLKQDQGARL
ncbi:MAG: hypothetical protein M1828_003205 [Chrysothrix sp. TS-e1954]|nr:MAG: hypothetical protein M1828_003205 [Chrysothrix sp. TS-e1954]